MSLNERLNNLEECVHILEATANHYYDPDDKAWNILLKCRDRIQKLVDEEYKKGNLKWQHSNIEKK